MLLSSQVDFNQTSSSNPPGSPPEGSGGSGSGGSGRGDRFRNIFGFGGRRSSDGHASRGRSQLDTIPSNHHFSRDKLRDFAVNTLRILHDGEYFPPGADKPYDLETKMKWTDENTRYYGPDAGRGGEMLESEFFKINKESGDGDGDIKMGAVKDSEKAATMASGRIDDTPIHFGEYSTLFAARKLHSTLAKNPNASTTNCKIGVLNFASAKRPGGGFINGSQAQEESIARASTLYPSLTTPAASRFYRHYHDDPDNAYYTHAMVYSPGIVLVRDDSGGWRSPVEVDVLTCAAVNAGDVRRELEKEEGLRREREEMEVWTRKREKWRRDREKASADSEKARRRRTLTRVKVTKEKDDEKTEAEEKETNNPESRRGVMKKAEEIVESKTTFFNSLSSQTQAFKTNPDKIFALALSDAESQIQHTMYARISRILSLFELHQIPHLILGSFGTGVFQNRIDLVASIFADLLVKPGGRFKNVFQTVVFGILGKETLRVFLDVFWTAEKRAGGHCVFWDREMDEREDEKVIKTTEREAGRSTLVVPNAAHAGAASADPTVSAATDRRIAEGKEMIPVNDTMRGTEYFRPESSRLKYWQQGPALAIVAERHGHKSRAEVYILKMSTLEGTHFLCNKFPVSRVGVLNLASPHGANGQGETSYGVIMDSESVARQEKSIIGRASNLSVSLQTPEARPFYELHDQDKGGYYTHAMIYSSCVTISRDDQGQRLQQPYRVEVVTSVGVNAHVVRSFKNGSESQTEDNILSVMRERMGRILALFERVGTRNLVLGSFGTGVLPSDVGGIWRELIGKRFQDSFDNVVFAIPEDRRRFESGFNGF